MALCATTGTNSRFRKSKHLGHPDIPEAPNTPDDENEYYVSFKVNVHAWAKRVQNVIL